MHYQLLGGLRVSDKSRNNQSQDRPKKEADQENKHHALNNLEEMKMLIK